MQIILMRRTTTITPIGTPSGHYARHVRSVLGASDEDEKMYTITCPGYQKAIATRAIIRIACVPPHESLAEEVAHDPAIKQQVRTHCRDGTLPPRDVQRPVFVQAPRKT